MNARDEARPLVRELRAWQEHTGDTALRNLLNRAANALLDEPVPADERDELETAIRRGLRFDFGMKPDDAREAARTVVPRLAGFRRQGPVTDDTEWEYEAKQKDATLPYRVWFGISRERSRLWAEKGYLIRRRRKAGPWEPVGPEETTR